MLAALGVVRERDTGSYTNLTVSPASVGEFLIGKQLAYTLVGTLSFMGVFVLATQLFGLDVKGSGTALALGGILYLLAATGWGLVIGSLLRSQIAAIIGTAILCVVPAINFSGYLHPVGSLEGAGWWIGHLFPALWFQGVSVGVFAKGLRWRELLPNLMALLAFAAVLPTIARLLLKKQER
jgi:ribosome-dependent ATPase